MRSQDLEAEDDQLICPIVGAWAETKYRLLALYDELFSKGMKSKWKQRVYIDLYAGAGHSRVDGTQRFFKASPMIALSVTCPFDKYIFCEEDQDLVQALKVRVKHAVPEADVAYIHGKCDVAIERICGEIPAASPENSVLSLCVVDPFDFGLKFGTIRRLSDFFVDFVVLLAVGMDANRNYEHYVEGDSKKIDEALGNTEWRKRWESGDHRRKDFRSFLAEEFSSSMESLKYIKQPLHKMKLVRSTAKNLPLYYVALFSRHQTAYKFWEEVLKYSTDQRLINFE